MEEFVFMLSESEPFREVALVILGPMVLMVRGQLLQRPQSPPLPENLGEQE
jgi:hypothetical protein